MNYFKLDQFKILTDKQTYTDLEYIQGELDITIKCVPSGNGFRIAAFIYWGSGEVVIELGWGNGDRILSPQYVLEQFNLQLRPRKIFQELLR